MVVERPDHRCGDDLVCKTLAKDNAMSMSAIAFVVTNFFFELCRKLHELATSKFTTRLSSIVYTS